jgi:hypothetical protein
MEMSQLIASDDVDLCPRQIIDVDRISKTAGIEYKHFRTAVRKRISQRASTHSGSNDDNVVMRVLSAHRHHNQLFLRCLQWKKIVVAMLIG